MKNILYHFIRCSVKLCLSLLHKNIYIHGYDNIPRNKPVLFLPNHQSALIDVLLVGIYCGRKPYFITRASVFGNPFLDAFFNFLRMIPIYRFRNGRSSLAKNDAVFNTCAGILNKGHAMVLFPEANHNLKRTVRPLSKGFTRIIARAKEIQLGVDVQIVPVGLNYKNAVGFPDEVAIYFGKPIIVSDDHIHLNETNAALVLKEKVTHSLQQLTTHIPSHLNYKVVLSQLKAANINFLNPIEANTRIKVLGKTNTSVASELPMVVNKTVFDLLFMTLNFPLLILWRSWVKPNIKEKEFIGTFRFALAFVGFPVSLICLFIFCALAFNFLIAFCCVVGIFLYSVCYIKYLAE